MMTGFSASTSIFASSATAPESPIAGAKRGSFGIESFASSGIGSSCSALSATMRVGPSGGVIVIW